MNENFEAAADQREADVAAAASLQQQRAAITERAMENLAKIGGEGRLQGPAEDLKTVAFFAPVEKNTRYLVRPGTAEITERRGQDGARLREREGDIWLQFIDGIVVMSTENADDQIRIAWCEANPQVCRNIQDPMTEAWAYMKELQKPTAWREATLNPNIDIERLLQGDPAGNTVRHKSVDHAREQVAKMNEG